MRALVLAAVGVLCALPLSTGAESPDSSGEPTAVHVDRAGRRVYLLDDAGRVVDSDPVGVGRGGLGTKKGMHDSITPTGDFTVALVLSRGGTRNAVDPRVMARFSKDREYSSLLSGDPGLARLFANMNSIDFDGDGAPDAAYGTGYIGLTSEGAVTGPMMRRFSRDRTAYWYGIALHNTPAAGNIGQAKSGGCVHLTEAMLARLVDDEILTIGSTVTISDGPPALR